jgi:hypothetical protein
LSAVTPFLTAGRLSSYRRPNIEIDERVQHVSRSTGAGLRIRLGPSSVVSVSGQRARIEYGEVPSGLDVASQLGRRQTEVDVEVVRNLTPLTTLHVGATGVRERFEASSLRNNDARTVFGGFTLDPFALISGTARAGYKQVDFRTAAVPTFTGLVADAGVNYLLRERTRFGLNLVRDVDVSIEDEHPYFVNLSADLSVRQAVGFRWDVEGSIGRSRASYRERDNLGDEATRGRTDRQVRYGAGVGFHVRPGARAGFEVKYFRRLSSAVGREFEGFRFGGAFTYGY